MTNLTNQAIQSVYGDYLTTTNNGQGLSIVLKQLQDGFGNASPITIATNAVNFDRQGGNTFQLDGGSVTAEVIDINSICKPNPECLGTGAITVPRGTSAERPNPEVTGMIRYNTQLNAFEGYTNIGWQQFLF